MEMLIAIAASTTEGERIATAVRETLRKSYSSLLANVFYDVFTMDSKKSAGIPRAPKTFDGAASPIVITIESAEHDKVIFVVNVPSGESLPGRGVPTILYATHNEKTDEFVIEPRTIKVRGIAYAIAAAVARRASIYIDFGDNK